MEEKLMARFSICGVGVDCRNRAASVAVLDRRRSAPAVSIR